MQDLQNILVIRFGSLGDLCLLGWSLAGLADAPGATERRVTVVTKQAFGPLVERMRGVDEVITLDDSSLMGLIRLGSKLNKRDWDLVLDAHGVLRSHGLRWLAGLAPHRRIRKDTSARLALLRGSGSGELAARTMRQRFDEVFTDFPLGASQAAGPPLISLATDQGQKNCLGLAPGAQWDTKRWPQEYFASFLREFRRHSQSPVRVFLGPREELWFAGSELEKACQEVTGVNLMRRLSLIEVGSNLAGCSLLLTNDSGLLHLAEAVGTPVAAFFGPTVQDFGYFPCLPGSRVFETELDCRPCSRNGKKSCHRGDLACLREITPEQVIASLPGSLSA